jgi:hypothetical protein
VARSVAVGAMLATANLWVLARVVEAMLPGREEGVGGEREGDAGEPEKPAGAARQAWRAVGTVKTVTLLGVATLLMVGGVAAPLPLMVGLCSLPIGIAIGALVSNRGA